MFEYILLAVALAVFLFSWYKPIPYGRFSTSGSIPNRWFIGLANIPATTGCESTATTWRNTSSR